MQQLGRWHAEGEAGCERSPGWQRTGSSRPWQSGLDWRNRISFAAVPISEAAAAAGDPKLKTLSASAARPRSKFSAAADRTNALGGPTSQNRCAAITVSRFSRPRRVLSRAAAAGSIVAEAKQEARAFELRFARSGRGFEIGTHANDICFRRVESALPGLKNQYAANPGLRSHPASPSACQRRAVASPRYRRRGPLQAQTPALKKVIHVQSRTRDEMVAS